MTTETPTAADAAQALDQIAVWQRGIDAAATLTRFALSQQQVSAELDRAIAAKRDTLAADTTAAIDAAKAEGRRQADALVADAQARVRDMLADAAAKVAAADAAVASKSDELAKLQADADTLRAQLRQLAGS
jgi:hypothetical protein